MSFNFMNNVDVLGSLFKADVMPWTMLLPYIVVVDGKPEADVITSITSRWQMLLPFFYLWQIVRKISFMFQHLKMADVIAKWQMEWPLQGRVTGNVITIGRWCSHISIILF